jgi:uncharacterized protein
MSQDFDVEPMSLSELGAFLASEAMPESSMSLPELDGLLTAVLVCPDLSRPSAWLPAIWSYEEPVFESDEEMERVLLAVMERYREISDALPFGPDALRSLFGADLEGGARSVGLWAAGFIQGMCLSPDSWDPLVKEEESRVFLIPILAFATEQDDAPPESARDEVALQELLDNAGEIIPACVAAMNDFFDSIRHHYQGKTKLGRNDPCFCGSGRKFKKCCGAGRV